MLRMGWPYYSPSLRFVGCRGCVLDSKGISTDNFLLL